MQFCAVLTAVLLYLMVTAGMEPLIPVKIVMIQAKVQHVMLTAPGVPVVTEQLILPQVRSAMMQEKPLFAMLTAPLQNAAMVR